MVDNVIKVAKKKGKIEKREILFSKEEIDYIHSLDDIHKESVVFILFCLYKYYGNTFKFKDNSLFKEARIPRGKIDISEFINSRKDRLFYINYNSDDITYSPTEFVTNLYNENNIVLRISDFKNIVYYYRQYLNINQYIICEKCSCIEEKKSNAQIYCKECAREVEVERKRNWWRKKPLDEQKLSKNIVK